MYNLGFRSYFTSYKNIMLTTMNLLYLVNFILKLYSILMVKFSKSTILIMEQNWNNSNYSDVNIIDHLYWLNGG